MAKILCLAQSGFGKSTSIGNIPELGIQGLDPTDTYLISVTSKPLPFRGSSLVFPITTPSNLKAGKRVVTDNAATIAEVLNLLVLSPLKNIVIDDFNYVMQNWYMANALAKGWDSKVSSF